MTAEAPTSAPRLIDGPDAAPATALLAHGAVAPMDSPFLAAIAGGLAQQGWRVVRFEYPSMARQRILGRRQGPDRMPLLLASVPPASMEMKPGLLRFGGLRAAHCPIHSIALASEHIG